jgi:hypothetical protein
MDIDRNRRGPAGTPASHDDTRTSPSPPVGAPEAETFDHLKRHDPSRPPSSAAGTMARWRGDEVRWVRASDALAQSSGRATGRGIVWTAQANRLPRLAPLRQTGTGRRAIARASTSPRASKLAPVTAFGTRREPSTARTGVWR